MYCADKEPITFDVKGAASFGANVSLSHSNSTIDACIAIAFSKYPLNFSNVLLISSVSSVKTDYGFVVIKISIFSIKRTGN